MSSGKRRNVNPGANSIVYSGRGRPRTKEIVDRPLPVGIVLQQQASPSTGDLYKNRKIRVGGPFQAKVPKEPLVERNEETGEIIANNYESCRPLPELVSNYYPHLTNAEVEEAERIEQNIFTEGSVDCCSAMDVDNTILSTQQQERYSSITPSGSSDSVNSSSQKTGSDGGQDDDANDNDDGNNNNNNNADDREDYLKTKRGGLLLCPTATEASDDYWSFVKPLLLPIEKAVIDHTRNSPSTHDPAPTASIDSKAWQSKILQWYLDKEQRKQFLEQEENGIDAQQPKRRGRKPKRKKEAAPQEEDTDIFEWYRMNVMKNNSQVVHQHSRPNKKARKEYLESTKEEEAQAIQHLWLRHRGRVSAAKLETMVQLSAGKAVMARRLKKHKRLKEPSSFKEKTMWRLYIEQSILGLKTSGFSYLTNNAEARYPFPSAEKKNCDDITGDVSCHVENDLEVQKEIWKAVLAFGNAIEEQIKKAGSEGGDDLSLPKLSTLMCFLNHAFRVRPIPEDIFRAPSVPPEINACLNNITEYTEKARDIQAELIDLLYDTNSHGVDTEALQKLMEKIGRALPVELDEAEELNHQLSLVMDWQRRLDVLVEDLEVGLSTLEELAEEGRTFAFRSKSLVQLEHRIHKAYLLRDRFDEWRKSCIQDEEDLQDKKESVKFLAAMVRDANRLKFTFPEVTELLEIHRSVEAWIDRANIAIRSRISLNEIKTLIKTGEDLPVDLSEYMEKLHARACLAEQWLGQFKQIVPCPEPSSSIPETQGSGNVMLGWMSKMREALHEGDHGILHELASEGSRIPVEVDCVKLLQIEIDAKNWTAKAKKWIPELAKKEEGFTCRKGKIDDLREHLEKAEALREKLVLPDAAKDSWVLDGEEQMVAIVEAADDWYMKYKPYLDWDNRRNEGRSCLSMKTLRRIVDEGNAIYANCGSMTAKMTRILGQAEEWIKEHQPVLLRCSVVENNDDQRAGLENPYTTVQAMNTAVEAAASAVSLDLDEAMEVKRLAEKVRQWSDRVTNAAPKRSKRQGRGRKAARFSVEDIVRLIEEAASLPIDTSEDVNRLQMELSAVQEWRAKARGELENINIGFQKLREVVDEVYGSPVDYSRSENSSSESDKNETDKPVNATLPDLKTEHEEKKFADDMSLCDTASVAGSEKDGDLSYLGSGNCNVNKLIKAYLGEAKSFGVISGEVEAADQLEKISSWCVRSLKYLDTQRDVFDKRFFGAFDRFLAEGKDLIAGSQEKGLGADIKLEDMEFADKLNASWRGFVSDQLQRLEVLVADRERFISWCSKSEELLFADEKKRPPLEKLKSLSDESKDFPSVCDMVQRVRGLYNKATEWVEATGKILSSEEKLSRLDAKTLMDEGEKLGFLCEELKTLRNAHRAARSWASRVKKCKVVDGADASAVQGLIEEHDRLLIEMPEELSKLQGAMANYCICRRPYSGFMIGCDECEEWYHGSCVGISESKADRVDKYVCVRCCTMRVFKNSAKDVVGIIRKWICKKDFKKARQIEAQKHQRKVRKETKDIEKLQAEINSLQAQPTMPDAAAPVADNTDVPATEAGVVLENTALTESATGPPAGPEVDAEESNSSLPRPTLSPEEVALKISKATDSIRQCERRLSVLSEKAEKQKQILKEEDTKAVLLQKWCLRVRSLVLFPKSVEEARSTRPKHNGLMSDTMKELASEAEKLGISEIADIKAAVNAFGCMAWSLLALSTLAKKPTMKEFELLVQRASSLKFPDEKAVRTIRAIHSRGASWQDKALKALAPVPGETKGFDLEVLKELEEAADDTPLRLPEESLISASIAEKGERHCICGGPSDARFMLSCDKCDRWYHGPCVNQTKDDVTEDTHWVCPPCNGQAPPIDITLCGILWDEMDDFKHTGKTQAETQISSVAPDASKMWPPYGLLGSEAAVEALGEECSAIPDTSGTLPQSHLSHVGTPASFMGAVSNIAMQVVTSASVDKDATRIQGITNIQSEPQAYPWIAQTSVNGVKVKSQTDQTDLEQRLSHSQSNQNTLVSSAASTLDKEIEATICKTMKEEQDMSEGVTTTEGGKSERDMAFDAERYAHDENATSTEQDVVASADQNKPEVAAIAKADQNKPEVTAVAEAEAGTEGKIEGSTGDVGLAVEIEKEKLYYGAAGEAEKDKPDVNMTMEVDEPDPIEAMEVDENAEHGTLETEHDMPHVSQTMEVERDEAEVSLMEQGGYEKSVVDTTKKGESIVADANMAGGKERDEYEGGKNGLANDNVKCSQARRFAAPSPCAPSSSKAPLSAKADHSHRLSLSGETITRNNSDIRKKLRESTAQDEDDAKTMQDDLINSRVASSSSESRDSPSSQLKAVAMEMMMAAPLPVQNNGR